MNERPVKDAHYVMRCTRAQKVWLRALSFRFGEPLPKLILVALAKLAGEVAGEAEYLRMKAKLLSQLQELDVLPVDVDVDG